MNSTLTSEQNDRVREGVRQLIAEMGTASDVASVLGRDPGWVSSFLAGRKGASHATAAAVAHALDTTVNELLGIELNPAKPLREIPGFDAALAEARSLTTRYSDDLWDRVGLMVIGKPNIRSVDAPTLCNVAQLLDGLRVKMLTSGSDTSPPSRPGGHKKSGSKIRRR